MNENSKYYTYGFMTSSLPGVSTTLMIDPLSAQKHFLLNAVYKYSNLSSEEKKYVKNVQSIKFEGSIYDEETLELIKSSEIPRYVVCTKTYRGLKCPVDQIIPWVAELTKVFESNKIALRMHETRAGIVQSDAGYRIRPTLGFDRKDSPISLITKEGKSPMVYAYLMIIGAKNT
jgi:hypothetical protein